MTRKMLAFLGTVAIGAAFGAQRYGLRLGEREGEAMTRPTDQELRKFADAMCDSSAPYPIMPSMNVYCSKPQDHPGPHVARANGSVMHTWGSDA